MGSWRMRDGGGSGGTGRSGGSTGKATPMSGSGGSEGGRGGEVEPATVNAMEGDKDFTPVCDSSTDAAEDTSPFMRRKRWGCTSERSSLAEKLRRRLDTISHPFFLPIMLSMYPNIYRNSSHKKKH